MDLLGVAFVVTGASWNAASRAGAEASTEPVPIGSTELRLLAICGKRKKPAAGLTPLATWGKRTVEGMLARLVAWAAVVPWSRGKETGEATINMNTRQDVVMSATPTLKERLPMIG